MVMSAFAGQDPVCIRINGDEILYSEFVNSYRRHIADTGTEISSKDYLELFVLSKLKVEAAKAARLDTTSAFRKQQEENRSKLIEAYLTDKQVTDSSARALYDRIGTNENSGQVQIMQIVRYLPQTITSRHLEEEKSRMDSLYGQIRNQPDIEFASLVERYSDDKRCRWIERLQTTAELEDIAFSLSKGGVSEPFFTPEGIHILKVIDRKDRLAYEDVCNKLTERLVRKDFLDKGTESIVERLKKEYQYITNQAAIDELLAKGETVQTLFTIDGRTYTGAMFKRFAASHPRAVKRQLNGFISKSLLDYENENLERRHPEVRYALQQSNESYLIKEVTRQKIDLPAINDRAGLATYFKFHSSDYRWESPRYKGAVLHCADKKTAKQAKKLLKKVAENAWVDTLRQTFNTDGTEKIKVEQGVFADGDNEYIDKLVFKKGSFDPLMSYPFTVVVGKKQKGPDDYREVIEQVRTDYRRYLDAYWMRELKESAKIEINQEVLKTVNNN